MFILNSSSAYRMEKGLCGATVHVINNKWLKKSPGNGKFIIFNSFILSDKMIKLIFVCVQFENVYFKHHISKPC